MKRLAVTMLLGCALASLPAAGAPSGLSFPERVDAQRAIEQVYGTRDAATRSMDEPSLPDRILEQKVRSYLKQSAALEAVWDIAITPEMLRAEVERMASRTRMPDRLRAVAEPVPLPEPAGSSDPSLAICSAEGVWVSPGFDNVPSARYGAAVLWTGSRMIVWGGSDGHGPVATGGLYDPVVDAWYPMTEVNAPSPRQYPLAVWTGTRMIVWGGYGANYLDRLDTGGVYDPLTDTWTATIPTGAPSGRNDATAVWAGSRMIVWGGHDGSTRLATGAAYDPAADTWTPVATTNAPSARSRHGAVSTGSRMIIWGGYTLASETDDGAIYDPAVDVWEPMTTLDAPSARQDPAAVWTGSEMIVYGGRSGSTNLTTGGRYDPLADAWEPTSTVDAPAARSGAAVTWIGDSLVVWGGRLLAGETNDAHRYDPATDVWSALTTVGAPSPRNLASAVWTGTRLVIWGGLYHGTGLTDGGRYDPGEDSWMPITARPAKGYGQVWTGSLSITWSPIRGGFTYDPATDTSAPISSVGQPTSLNYFTTVWTGSKMLVWGGDLLGYLPAPGSGGIYDLATDTWTPISQVDAPVAREGHTAVWTGTRMIIWGGWHTPDYLTLDDGHAFDPQTNSWSAIAGSGLAPRAYHSALWTGSRMIIWGGVLGDLALGYPTLNDGALYDPTTNTWSPVTATDAPGDRYMHTAVWTGSRMIVWGGGRCAGSPYCLSLAEGASYDPSANTWQALGTAGTQPPAMSGHAAVWTGSSMIVYDGPGSGAQYFPSGGSWTAVSSDHAPYATGQAIWTGTGMGVGEALFLPDVYADKDGDGWTPCDGDCNDARWTIHPNAAELCNGIDDDCDGIQDDGAALYCSDGDDCTMDACVAGTCTAGGTKDLDGDTHPDGLCGGDDCDDGDAAVWHAPVGVSGMTLGVTTPTPLSWDGQDLVAGPGTAYDLVSGTLSLSAILDFTGGSCLAAGGPASFDDGRTDPAPGEAFWYLARARNGCGTATYGSPPADAGIPPCP